ncbi:BTAD domain-containing putative transcriptional regulator [Mycobacterium paraterrae]|uniref:FHA domain-containing protein n=1 Tax=Mycobacterium paraterrae TaxID=577492 RepID=A0ABY3VZG6_9MYCO|nr:BTAD domain-containing putative transcriptional regulator [Mycobacterium paraterrae]UMB72188.1 FHA domain-containing protein [Mycobacterium paraterrae]
MHVDGTDVALGAPKQRAVLALLLISRNRPVAIESLMDAAWPQGPPPEARASLHTYVSNIRRLLSKGGVDSAAVLQKAQPGYRLNVPDAACDIGRFTVGHTAGMKAAADGRFEQASSHLSTALSEWRGPVLEDLRDYEFVDAFAVALAEDRLVAQTARAEAEIACGRAYSVLSELESLASEHPYREPLWTQLITAYYLTERQYDALEAYRRLKATLSDELGVDPGPSLRDLHQRILRQEPLDVSRVARATAKRAVATLERRTKVSRRSVVAVLRDTAGGSHPLRGAATRIGRLPDNDIVLDDAMVSRHHAMIVDTGASFVVTDLRSANGVEVAGSRVRGSATLDDGDCIRIGDHEFTFEIGVDG